MRRCIVWTACALLGVVLAATIRIARADSGVEVEVTIRVDPSIGVEPFIGVQATYRTPASEITLAAQVPDRLLAVSDFVSLREALAESGARLTYDVVGRDDAKFRATRYHIPVLNGSATLDYHVKPPTYFPYNSCGEARTYGTASKDCVVLCAPSVLLLPCGKIRSISFSFDVPKDWGQIAGPTLLRAPEESELWGTTFILGKFGAKRSLGDGLERVGVLCHGDVGRDAEELARQALSRLAEQIGKPKRDILVVLCPANADVLRMDTTGNSGLLVLDMPKPDVASVRELLRRAVAQWYGYTRLEIDTSRDSKSWFAVGVSEYLAAKIASELLTGHADLANYIEYTWLRDKSGVRANLEEKVGSKRDIPDRRLLGAAICYEIDRRLEREGGIGRLLQDWNGISPPDALLKRCSDVIDMAAMSGVRTFPWESSWAIDARESPKIRPDADQLTFLVTSNTRGYLETCGCKINQDGGIARRATYVDQVRKARPEASLLVDLGNFFPIEKGRSALDALVVQEGQLLMECMRMLRYDAVATGAYELAGGLRAPTCQSAFDGAWLAGGISMGGVPICSNVTIATRGNTKVAFVGLVERLEQGWIEEPQERNLSDYQFPQSWNAVQADIESAASRADIVVLCGQISPKAITAMAKAGAPVDVVLTSCPPLFDEVSLGGFVGGIFVAYEVTSSYGITRVDIGIDPGKRVVAGAVESRMLTAELAGSPEIQKRLNDFYDSLSLDADATSVPDIFYGDDWITEGFVGADRCKACHLPQYSQWISTAHSSALDTLIGIHRDKQPKCVVCHVLGLGAETGFSLQRPEMRLAGVQCEHCHGTGRDHVMLPDLGNIRRSPTRETCRQCHSDEHSDLFELRFDTMLQEVTH